MVIDGSRGEGGGQVLRTALTLSAITGTAFSLARIRARRPQPGLKPQHIKAIEAVASICHARHSPVAPGEQVLHFEPGIVSAGEYRFDIGTAGSTGLVLQTMLLPLSFAAQPSEVSVTGGTHVPWSPCFHYLAWHWRQTLADIGFSFDLTMERAGFYPPGGGIVHAVVEPVDALRPLTRVERGELHRVHGLSGVARLPLSIAERQRTRTLQRLGPLADRAAIELESVAARSPGTYLILLAEYERSQQCFTALGARGKRAEAVADEAVDEFERHHGSTGAVDAHLADQLILPLALAPGESKYSTAFVTPHLLTNADIVMRFLQVSIEVDGAPGQAGTVTIRPRGDRQT